jgi:Predicted metal binding domain
VAEGSDPAELLVDPAISSAKLDRELEAWSANAGAYRRRGIVLLGRDGLTVDVGFAARVSVNPPASVPATPVVLPVITSCARFDFGNYDLWPPSVRFIDCFSGEPWQPPVKAVRWTAGVESPNVLIQGHPDTGEPFLCLQGIREYHRHHEHSGDDWLLHRGRGLGTLAATCDQIWQLMAENVLGIRFEGQQMTANDHRQTMLQHVAFSLIQGDRAALLAQLQQLQQPPQPAPPTQRRAPRPRRPR